MVASILKLELEFHIFFKIYPLSFVKKLHNVIHLTVGSNKKNHGKEVLGVWFSEAGNGKLKITVPTKESFFETDPVLKTEYSTVHILQQLENGSYIYTIKINEEIVFSEKNLKPKIYKNVQVYASNPWDLVSDAYISNMYIFNGKKGISKISFIKIFLKRLLQIILIKHLI